MEEPDKNTPRYIAEKIQLHTAEYTNLTTRGNNLFYINNIILGAIITGIATLGPNLTTLSESIIWGVILGIQGLLIFTAWLTYEHYLIVKYLQTNLRRRIKELIGSIKFWEFETFLLDNKKSVLSVKAEFSGTVLYMVYLALCVHFHPPSKCFEYYLYALSGAGFVTYALIMLNTYKLRRKRWGEKQ